METKNCKSNLDCREKFEKDVLTSFRNVMEKISLIWKELGVSDEHQAVRSKTARNVIIGFIETILSDEIRIFTEIKERVNRNIKDLHELTIALNVEPVNINDSMTLLETDNYLNENLDKLMHEKESRRNRYSELKDVEKQFCDTLNVTKYEISSISEIPSKTELQELQNHVNELKQEREIRFKRFQFAKRELTTIMEVTEITPETFFEREVMYYDDEQFLLSTDNLKELDLFVQKVYKMKSELEKQKNDLLEKLIQIWDKLNTSEDVRKNFLECHKDFRPATMQAIQQEIEQCLEIRRQNIGQRIEALSEELQELWGKCHISEFDQKLFLTSVGGDPENVLDAYEMKVCELNKYFKDAENIMKKIKKRQELWDLMIALEGKANDPNRLVNRGGTLLIEERERKKLQKDLPKLETELFKAIAQFETSSGKPFRFNGESFHDFVNNQWAQRLKEKEQKKVKRQRQLSVDENEDIRKTPITKRPLVTRTESTPRKMLRSSTAISISTQGLCNQIKTPTALRKANKKGVRSTPRRTSPRFHKNVRKALKECNKMQRSSSLPDDLSYSEFAEQLNGSTCDAFHSSVLPSKIDFDHNKEQDAIKKQPRFNPVRAKLGLPFLT